MQIVTTFKNFAREYIIGRQYDNRNVTLVVDCTDTIVDDRDVALVLQRSIDDSAYIAATTYEKGILQYTFTATDLAVNGYLKGQLIIYGPDNRVMHSAIASFKVNLSLEASNDIPEPIEVWIDEANRVLKEAHEVINTICPITEAEIETLFKESI